MLDYKRGKVTISKNTILLYSIFVMMFLRYLIPEYFISRLGSTISVSLAFLSLLLMITYVILVRFKIEASGWLLVAIYIEALMTTTANHGEVFSALFNSVYIIALSLVVVSTIDRENEINTILYAVRDVTFIFFVLNVIYGVLMPNGIPSETLSPNSPYFLYGNVNASLRAFLPGMCCSCLIDAKNGRRISALTIAFFLGFSYFCFRVYFMATGFVGMLLILVWIIFKPLLSKHTKKIFIAVIVAVTLFELFIVLVGGNTSIAVAINTFFGKSGSFSGRGYLWSRALMWIHQKPAFGYGVQSLETMKTMIGNQVGAHNYYLDIVYQRGIVGLILLIILLISPLSLKSDRITDSIYILIGFCCAYLIMFLAEPFIGTEYFHIPIFTATACLVNRTKKRLVLL